MDTNRQRAMEVVRRLLDGDVASEGEETTLLAEFESLVPDPRAIDLIYWPSRHPLSRDVPEDALTPERIVALACRYRPMET